MPEPPVSGADALAVVLAAGTMPREAYSEHLEDFLEQAARAARPESGRIRLALLGSATDDPELVRWIEGDRAVVVADNLCYGSRVHLDRVEENGDPIVQIKYKPDGEVLASVYVNEDGSITFQAAGASDEAEDEDDDAGYFPSYVEYMDEDEFLEDAYDMLKVGLAEFELDREQRSA